jgi:hypothetical protein
MRRSPRATATPRKTPTARREMSLGSSGNRQQRRRRRRRLLKHWGRGQRPPRRWPLRERTAPSCTATWTVFCGPCGRGASRQADATSPRRLAGWWCRCGRQALRRKCRRSASRPPRPHSRPRRGQRRRWAATAAAAAATAPRVTTTCSRRRCPGRCPSRRRLRSSRRRCPRHRLAPARRRPRLCPSGVRAPTATRRSLQVPAFVGRVVDS